jgi:hypothetical protein
MLHLQTRIELEEIKIIFGMVVQICQ